MAFVRSSCFAVSALVALMCLSAPALAGSFAGCPAHLVAPGASPAAAGQRDALAQAALFFGQVSPDEIAAALDGVAPGGWRDLTARFAGADARWRFLRPMALPDDPDALVLPPAQRQVMVRPLQDGQAAALLLAGLAEPAGDRLSWPLLVGLDRKGRLFLAEPLQPETCGWRLDEIAAAAEALTGGEH